MEVQEYVDALRGEGSAMADCARDHLGIPIPCCPGWDMLELVEHMGEMHHAVHELIERRTMDPDDIDDPVPPAWGVVRWFEDGIDSLSSAFLEVDPSLPVWSWAPQRNVAFWQRRIALETAIHRWDAESAVMDPAPLDPALAADGVDEFFSLHMLRDGADLCGDGEVIHFHSLDTHDQWSLRLGSNGGDLTHSHRSSAATVQATASDLLLLLWRRVHPSDVLTSGNARLIQRLLDRMDLS